MAKWTTQNIPDLEGRRAIVTGANSGLGYHTALELARRGAHVVMACRSATKAEAARTLMLAEAPRAELEIMALDVGDLESVRSFCAAYRKRHARLDLLINNAGVVAQPLGRTPQGFELQIGTNYFGPFAMTAHLLETLARTPGARIVNVASIAHQFARLPLADLNWERRAYNEWLGYGQSKLALLMHTYELDRRLRAAQMDVSAIAAHPGYAATGLVSSEMVLAKHWLGQRLMQLGNQILAQPAHMGALATLYAATSAEARGGDYIGPGGLAQFRGFPQKVKSTRASHNREAATRLWAETEQYTGLSYLPA